MRALAVIPARYGSQRFPGKPLAQLGDRTVVEWVHRAAAGCPHFDRVLVATDDERIAASVRGFGGEVEMTRSDHPAGTDRVAEAAGRHPWADVVANVQGDQPFVTSDQLTALLGPYIEGEAPEMTTLACPLTDPAAVADANVVKVVCDREGRALYFSRSPIPYSFEQSGVERLHHLGLYAFRADFLQSYAELAPTELEECERLEQLRVLEHGHRIRVCRTDEAVLEVNTPDDLERAHALLARSGAA